MVVPAHFHIIPFRLMNPTELQDPRREIIRRARTTKTAVRMNLTRRTIRRADRAAVEVVEASQAEASRLEAEERGG